MNISSWIRSPCHTDKFVATSGIERRTIFRESATMGRQNVRTRSSTNLWVGRVGLWITIIGSVFLTTTSCSDHVAGGASDEEIDAAEDALSAKAGQHTFGLGDGIHKSGKEGQIAQLWEGIKLRNMPLWEELRTGWSEDNDGDGHKEWSLRSARTIFYAKHKHKRRDTEFLGKWLDSVAPPGAVITEGLDPYVTISVHPLHSDKLVTPAEFRNGFEELLHEFSTIESPRILRWGIVNEPDMDLKGKYPDKAERARQAVQYFAEASWVLRRCKRDRICSNDVMLVAGEFAYDDEEFWDLYANSMSDAACRKSGCKIRRFPRIWSIHPYRDTIRGNTNVTAKFLRHLRQWERDEKLAPQTLRAWITESGTVLRMNGRCKAAGKNINDRPRAQYRGASMLFKMNDFPSQRVDRIYWWDFHQSAWCENQELDGHPWDSALVDYQWIKRPSYCALINAGKRYADSTLDECLGRKNGRFEVVRLAAVTCGSTCDAACGATCDASQGNTSSYEPPATDPENITSHPVYRWWSGGSFGDHFYTNDPEGEIAPDVGYVHEGMAFRTFTCDTPETKPFFRWWSESLTDHFYTTDPSGELAPAAGYISEGDIGCVASAPSQDTMALHRWWNPSIGDHFYSLDPSGELAPSSGYQYEGIAGYVLAPE
ncbi:hypothetical protein [Sorangium sp. So ce233]|uniref:hypothetical protein n=1 Tax=Sorangium sp. So ce233 TaxID=3133290 RepID=UPI003F63FC35